MSDFKPWTPIYTKLPGMDAEARKNAICRDSASLNQSALRAPTSSMIGSQHALSAQTRLETIFVYEA